MDEFHCTSSESGGDTSSSGSFVRLIDDQDNYVKGLPVRNSRNPKPQYKVATVHEPMPKTTRSRSNATVGRIKKQPRQITSRRKDVISRFLKECSQTPGKYGRVGSLSWYCELTNQINTPGSGKKNNLAKPVSNLEVMNWLNLPGLSEAYENLKANETQQQQQPTPCSSGKAAKDKEPSALLPPNKRLRPNPKSYLETAPTVLLRSENETGLPPGTAASVQENKRKGDEETSVGVSFTSIISTNRGPDEEPASSGSPSTARNTPKKSAVCPGPVTIINRNLSADELRAQATTLVEQLVVPSLANMKQEIIVEEAEGIVEQAEIVVEQAEILESEVIIGQRNLEQGTNPTECNKDNPNVQQKENQYQCQDSVDTGGTQANLSFPYESLGVLIQQEVRANRSQGLEPASEDIEMSEEEKAQATTQVLRSLHKAIDIVRQEFVRLTNLHFHRRAPVAMSVLGFVVDSLVSFVANYLNPEEPVEY